MDICSIMTGMELINGTYIIHTNNADIGVCFVTEEIVRIHASFDKASENESYVLMTTAWSDRLDPLFQNDRTRLQPTKPSIEETEATLTFITQKLKLVVEKNPLNFSLYSNKKEGLIPLYSTIPGNPFVHANSGRVTAYSAMNEDDCYYGFGEKAGLLNKNKTFLRERATDAMGYDAAKTDTLYKHIPFYLCLHRETQTAVGVFYHNFYESVFNIGCEKSNYWPRYSYWQADGGDIDLFLIGGDSIPCIIDHYTMLTGRPVLLPKRALGYQGSSMYYPELPQNCDDAVLDFVERIKEEGFPLDGFHLSSGYTSQNNKRCVFTWNNVRFKNPSAFFHSMKDKHTQTVPNVKPGVLLCHPLYQEFSKNEVFVRDSKDSTRNAIGRWWGGDGSFWDFTSAKGRDLWKKYIKDSLLEKGTDSIWNDNCEYDSLLDLDSLCDFDGKGETIGALKPIMSTLMCKAGAEAVSECHLNARPYIVCRSGSAGIQHYAQTWCGDNVTSWQTLKYNIPTITGMGLSGQPNEGADIGGFAGPAPDQELFVRWVQQGIFQPRFSIHSASSDNTVTEPWMFHEVTELIRSAILLRYRFTPYLYSAQYLASQTGAPIMRALVYDFQHDPNVYEESFEYLFGRDILVANVLDPGVSSIHVYLPRGCKWYDWNDHLTCYEGGQTITVPVNLSSIPMFIREGAMIAMADNQLYSMEQDHTTNLHLIVSPKDSTETVLYDDDGVTTDYKQNCYLKTIIKTEQDKDRFSMHVTYEGSYQDFVEQIMVELIAKEKSPYCVSLTTASGSCMLEHFLDRHKFDAATIGWYYSQSNRAVEIKYPNPATESTLTVSFEQFDLIGM